MTRTIKLMITIVCSAALIGLGWYVYTWELRPQVFTIYFLNLPRGHAVVIRTTHHKTILIDGGQTSDTIRELTKLIPFYRRRIDFVIVTNGLPKNVGGLVDVAQRYQIEKVIMPELMSTSTAFFAFQKILKEKKIPSEKVQKGDSFMVDDAIFSILFPDPNFNFNKTSTPELVLHIQYSTTTIVLLGDTSKTIQKSLSKEVGKIYLVEYAHTATKSRVSADFVSKADPDVIVSTKREETLHYEIK